jgi:hypothetical protein
LRKRTNNGTAAPSGPIERQVAAGKGDASAATAGQDMELCRRAQEWQDACYSERLRWRNSLCLGRGQRSIRVARARRPVPQQKQTSSQNGQIYPRMPSRKSCMQGPRGLWAIRTEFRCLKILRRQAIISNTGPDRAMAATDLAGSTTTDHRYLHGGKLQWQTRNFQTASSTA